MVMTILFFMSELKNGLDSSSVMSEADAEVVGGRVGSGSLSSSSKTKL